MSFDLADFAPDTLWLHKGSEIPIAGRTTFPLYNRRSYGWYLQILSNGQYEVVCPHENLGAIVEADVLFHVDPVTIGDKTEEGDMIKAVRPTWREIANHVKRNPEFLFGFPNKWRVFEMFLAATYAMDNFDEVILTPASNDFGRDVIARKTQKTSLTVLEQAKAYGPTRLVKHDEVRAMVGTMALAKFEANGSITTTSDFRPKIYSSGEFDAFVPDKLTLRNGDRLRDWLISLISAPKADC